MDLATDEGKDRVKGFPNDAVDSVTDEAGMAKDKLPGK